MRVLLVLLPLIFHAGQIPSTCWAQPGEGRRSLGDLLNSPVDMPTKPVDVGVEHARPRTRQPVPEATAIKKAQDLIRQVYEIDYGSATKNAEPLIRKLLDAARETKDPVRKYAMLLEAEEAAARIAEHKRVFELIDLRGGEFSVDVTEAKAGRLTEFLTSKAKTDPELLVTIFTLAAETARTGMELNSHHHAKAAGEIAVSAARALVIAVKPRRNAGMAEDAEAKRTQAVAIVRSIDRRAAMFDKYQQALKTLSNTPDDPLANGDVGQYLCFAVNDWPKGLPYLAKGARKDLAALAAMELELFATGKGKPTAAQVFSLAGKLWNFGEGLDSSPDNVEPMRAHAAALYRLILEDLDDPLDKAVAAKRVAAFAGRQTVLPGLGTRELEVLISLTSDWGSVTIHPANAVVINRQEVVRGERPWVVKGNSIGLSGAAFRSLNSAVRVICTVKDSAEKLSFETHKGDVGAVYLEVKAGEQVLEKFVNEGSHGGNAERSDGCRQEFPVVLKNRVTGR